MGLQNLDTLLIFLGFFSLKPIKLFLLPVLKSFHVRDDAHIAPVWKESEGLKWRLIFWRENEIFIVAVQVFLVL